MSASPPIEQEVCQGIVTSAHRSLPRADFARRSVVTWLRKPFDLDVLLATVVSRLDSRAPDYPKLDAGHQRAAVATSP